MAADGAGGGTGRINQHEGRGQFDIARIGLDNFGIQLGARQILRDAGGASRINLHRHHLGTHCRQLHGLAAGRRAQINHPLAAHIPQQGRG